MNKEKNSNYSSPFRHDCVVCGNEIQPYELHKKNENNKTVHAECFEKEKDTGAVG